MGKMDVFVYTFLGTMVLQPIVLTVTGAGLGNHAYHEVKILSYDAVTHTTIRAVESPSIIDDQTVEIIVNGKLLSRTRYRQNDFQRIWDSGTL